MRFFTEFHAKQVSSILLMILLFLYTGIIFSKLHIQTLKTAFLTGLGWVLLTVAFEFLLGNVILHLNINLILQEYNLPAGNLWILVLIAIGLFPFLHLRFRMISTQNTSHA